MNIRGDTMKKMTLPMMLLLILVGCRSQAIQINVHFNRLSGLAPGDRVVFESNEAGRVDTIHFNKDGSYRVGLEINRGFAHAATEFTRFSVVDDEARSGHKAVALTLYRREGKPLADGARVDGEEAPPSLGDQFNRSLEEGFAVFKKQMDRFSENLKNWPESKSFKELKKSLSELADNIAHSEETARERIKKEWLPRIERELKELKRRLEAVGRGEEAQPLQKELERSRKM
jgi:paraquat-inducible protein B